MSKVDESHNTKIVARVGFITRKRTCEAKRCVEMIDFARKGTKRVDPKPKNYHFI